MMMTLLIPPPFRFQVFSTVYLLGTTVLSIVVANLLLFFRNVTPIITTGAVLTLVVFLALLCKCGTC
jgi:hypothetical protein